MRWHMSNAVGGKAHQMLDFILDLGVLRELRLELLGHFHIPLLQGLQLPKKMDPLISTRTIAGPAN